MVTGNRPADGGHLIIEAEDYADFVRQEPASIPYIKKLLGAAEFINNKKDGACGLLVFLLLNCVKCPL